MSYNLKQQILGGVVKIIEEGATYLDEAVETTVSASVRPATVVSEMSSLGCVVDVGFDKTTETDTVNCYDAASDSYRDHIDEIVTADFIDTPLRQHSEPIYRLLFGTDSAIPDDGSDVNIFTKSVRSFNAWVAFEARSQTEKAQIGLIWVWCKVSLKEYPGFNKNTTIPVIRYQVMPSSLNSAAFATNL